jgi:hypothetical protein
MRILFRVCVCVRKGKKKEKRGLMVLFLKLFYFGLSKVNVYLLFTFIIRYHDHQ